MTSRLHMGRPRYVRASCLGSKEPAIPALSPRRGGINRRWLVTTNHCIGSGVGSAIWESLRLPLVISLVLFVAFGVRAQNANDSATDFFNSGAQFYISNSIPDALKRVETGLKIYPEDVKLKKLEELLKQQQQQQQQQQNQQNQQNQKNQQQHSQQKQSKQNQSQNKQSQSQNQQNQQQQQQQQQNSGQQQQNQANAQKKQEQAQQQQAMAMTPEEAKRLLDAQKGNEQVLQLKSQNQPENANPPVKDW
jgi:membrane protein involved in colicin uptake